MIKTKCIEFDNVALNGLMLQKILVDSTKTGSIDALVTTVNSIKMSLQSLQDSLLALELQVNGMTQTINNTIEIVVKNQVTEIQSAVNVINNFISSLDETTILVTT